MDRTEGSEEVNIYKLFLEFQDLDYTITPKTNINLYEIYDADEKSLLLKDNGKTKVNLDNEHIKLKVSDNEFKEKSLITKKTKESKGSKTPISRINTRDYKYNIDIFSNNGSNIKNKPTLSINNINITPGGSGNNINRCQNNFKTNRKNSNILKYKNSNTSGRLISSNDIINDISTSNLGLDTNNNLLDIKQPLQKTKNSKFQNSLNSNNIEIYNKDETKISKSKLINNEEISNRKNKNDDILNENKENKFLILDNEEFENIKDRIITLDKKSKKFDYYELIFEILLIIKINKEKNIIELNKNNKHLNKNQNLYNILKDHSNSIHFALLKLLVKYSKNDKLLSLNLYSIYEELFKTYNENIKNNYKSSNTNIKNVSEGILSKLILLNLVNDFLNLLKEILKEISFLISDYNTVKYTDYEKCSKLLHKLKNKKFHPILKNKGNSYTYTYIISLIIYEELHNLSLSSDGCQIRDNIYQYENMLKSHYKTNREILMVINIKEFQVNITYVGRELSKYLNKDFVNLFPNEFRNLQTTIFRKQIMHQKNNHKLCFYFIIKGSEIENTKYQILLIKSILFCYEDKIFLFGTYNLINYSFITSVKLSHIYYIDNEEDLRDEEKLIGICDKNFVLENNNEQQNLSLTKFLEIKKISPNKIEKLEILGLNENFDTIIIIYKLNDQEIEKLNFKNNRLLYTKSLGKKKLEEYEMTTTVRDDKVFQNTFAGSESSVKNNSINSMSSLGNLLNSKKKSRNMDDNLNIKYIYQNFSFISFIVWIIFFFIELKHMNVISANFFTSYDIYLSITDTYRSYFEILPGIIASSCILFKYDKDIDDGLKNGTFSCINNKIDNFLDNYNIYFNNQYNTTFNITELIIRENIYKDEEFKSNLDKLTKYIYTYNDKDTNDVYYNKLPYHDILSVDGVITTEEKNIPFNEILKILLSKLNEILKDGKYLNFPIFSLNVLHYTNDKGETEYSFDFSLANSYHTLDKYLPSVYAVFLNFNTMVNNGLLMEDKMYEKMEKTYHYYYSMEYMYLCVLYAYDIIVMFIIYLHVRMYERADLLLINSIRHKCYLSQYDQSINQAFINYKKSFGHNKEISDYSFHTAFSSKIEHLKNLSELYVHSVGHIINKMNNLYNDYKQVVKEKNKIKNINEKMKQSGNYNYNTDNINNIEVNLSNNIKIDENNNNNMGNDISYALPQNSGEKENKEEKPSKEKVLFSKAPINKYDIIFYIFFIVCPIEYFIYLMIWYGHFTDTGKTFYIIHKSIFSETVLNMGLTLFQIRALTKQSIKDANAWMNRKKVIYMEVTDAIELNVELSGEIKRLNHLIDAPSNYIDLNCDEYYKQINNSRINRIINNYQNETYIKDLSVFCNTCKIMKYQFDFNFIYSYHYSNVLNLLSSLNEDPDYIMNILMNGHYVNTAIFHLFIFFPLKSFIRNFVFVEWVNKIQVKINLLFHTDTATFVSFVGLLLIVLVGVYMIMMRQDYLKILNLYRVFEINKNDDIY